MKEYNLKKVLGQLNQWCATNNISVQSVYDECHGMTTQEIVYYLLGVVKEAVNQVVENTGAFQELYTFVHDYFDNLDIQSEINNKLDSMLEDGTLAEIINKWYTGMKFYNVLQHGLKNDGETDNYNAYKELCDSINTCSVIYFPNGKYNFSNSIAVPENCLLIGNGVCSELYFTNINTDYGFCITNGGSNVTIKNLMIDFFDNHEYVGVQRYTCIGVSNYTYESVMSKENLVSIDCDNILIDNVYTDGYYGLQCEIKSNSLSNVSYKNINMPKAQISMSPNPNGNLYNCMCNNINCSLFFIGYDNNTGNGFYLKNIFANIIRLADVNIVLDGFKINTKVTDEIVSKTTYNESLYIGTNGAKVSNGEINVNNKYNYGIRYAGETILDNIKIEGQIEYAIYTTESKATIYNSKFSSNSVFIGECYNTAFNSTQPLNVFDNTNVETFNVHYNEGWSSVGAVTPKILKCGHICQIMINSIKLSNILNDEILGTFNTVVAPKSNTLVSCESNGSTFTAYIQTDGTIRLSALDTEVSDTTRVNITGSYIV